MKLTNSFRFFQHWMKEMLSLYLWKFLLVYVNNIIIFSVTLKNHLHHLNSALTVLKNFEITLSLSKCHLRYSSIKMLEYHVFHLELSTVKEKMKVIWLIKFFKTIQKLETGLDFFEYYWKFVSHYTVIAESLIQLKTADLKEKFCKDKKITLLGQQHLNGAVT